jgi:hypothetical protein
MGETGYDFEQSIRNEIEYGVHVFSISPIIV